LLGLKETALAITAIAAVTLGIAVYQRTPDRVWNRLFAVHAVGGGIWTFLNYLLEVADSPTEASIWLRLTHPVVAMVICTVVDFAWVFPDRIDYAPTNARVALYTIGAVMGAVAFAPDLVRSIGLQGGIVNVVYGWPFVPFGIFTVGALGYADVVLLRKAVRLEGVQRVQVIWVLIGLAGSHFVASLVIIIIPLIWGTTAYSGWGAGGYIITLAGMSYAIAKHRLMRPETALRRVASAMVSAGVVLSIGIGSVEALQPTLTSRGVPMNLAYLATGLVMGMLIVLVHGPVTAFVKRLFSDGGDPASVQAGASSHILRTLDAEQVVRYLARALYTALEPTNVVVYTMTRPGTELAPRVIVRHNGDAGRERPAVIALNNRLVEVVLEEGSPVTRDQVFRFGPLEDARRLALLMDELDAQIAAPMLWEDELIGLVTLGPRLSGDMYVHDDLRFVTDMALRASLALRNADLYAETAALKDFNERILRQMDNAVVVTDTEERIVVYNEAAERLLGLPAEKALHRSIGVLPEGIANCIRASLGSGRTLPSQHMTIERDHSLVPLACSTSPLSAEGSGSQGAVAVISDLTLIQELDREREEAERLALIRMISAGMAHEIRNPLVAIRTFAELAPKRLDDPDFRSNFLTVAQQEISRIDRLVGDLLTLSKPADAVVEPIDVNEISRQVTQAAAGLAETQDVAIELVTDDLKGFVQGDSARFHQALTNLVRNAIEAEPAGGRVRLTTELCAGDEGGSPSVRIRVHNAGSYIPPEQHREIFRPFVSRKTTGTGLGLAISRTIVEELDGTISVESSVEGGTEFVVELPVSNSRAPAGTVGDR